MKARIKTIRKNLGFTQADFGQKIGVKGNTITGYEKGLRNPSSAVINSICREFGVNEVWLRTGEGEPFAVIDKEDRFFNNLGKLGTSDNDFVINIINYLAEASPEKLEIIEEFMKKCLGLE